LRELSPSWPHRQGANSAQIACQPAIWVAPPNLWHGADHRRDDGRRGLRKQLRRTCGDRVSPEHVSAASAQLDAAQASEIFLLLVTLCDFFGPIFYKA